MYGRCVLCTTVQGALGIHDPVEHPQSTEEASEGLAIGQRGGTACEDELAVLGRPRRSPSSGLTNGTRANSRQGQPTRARSCRATLDRDATFDAAFGRAVEAFGLTAVRTAPRSPWQNPYVERVIGSIRRECLDHVIVFNERHLRRVLRTYVAYYQRSRTHLALGKDAPEERAVEPTGAGRIVARPEVGGLHHRYERQAA